MKLHDRITINMVMESHTPFWKKKTLNLLSSGKYSGNPHKGFYVQKCIPSAFLYECCKVNSLTSCNSTQDCFKNFEPNLYIVLANFRSGRWQKKKFWWILQTFLFFFLITQKFTPVCSFAILHHIAIFFSKMTFFLLNTPNGKLNL